MNLEGGSPTATGPPGTWWERTRCFVRSSLATLQDYVVRVYQKAGDDNIFFLASGITFSVIVASVPFLLILVALISLTLQQAAAAGGVEPIEQLRYYLDVLVPFLRLGEQIETDPGAARELIERAMEQGRTIGIISFVAFIWLSTRLFGAIRTVLREIFDLRQSRGVIQGKIFDAEMVIVSSVLLILNIGITIVLNLGKARGIEVLGLSPLQVGFVERIYGSVTAFVFIFLLFLLIYKYVPARRIPWRMAVIAATFTAVLWELLKAGFGLYLTQIADYRSVYGGVATLVIVVVWIYYLSIVFVLGGEVAQVHELRRVRRQQREVLE